MPDTRTTYADTIQDEERCQLTELIKTQCAHCTGAEPPDKDTRAMREELLALPGWFMARYPGTCCSCGEQYDAGAAIVPLSVRVQSGIASGRSRYLAECCTEDGTDD